MAKVLLWLTSALLLASVYADGINRGDHRDLLEMESNPQHIGAPIRLTDNNADFRGDNQQTKDAPVVFNAIHSSVTTSPTDEPQDYDESSSDDSQSGDDSSSGSYNDESASGSADDQPEPANLGEAKDISLVLGSPVTITMTSAPTSTPNVSTEQPTVAPAKVNLQSDNAANDNVFHDSTTPFIIAGGAVGCVCVLAFAVYISRRPSRQEDPTTSRMRSIHVETHTL